MFAILDRCRGRSYKARLLNPYDAFWDARLGVQTFGFYPGSGGPDDEDWRVHYTPTPYKDMFRLLRMVELENDDVFVDLGAGLGRAVFAASWLGAGRAVGVEVVRELCDQATRSLRHSRLTGRNVQFICTKAQDYDTDGTSVLFMFHPFGEATLRRVLHNIETARAERSYRPLRVIYVNPVFDTVLQEMKWLERLGRVPATASWFSTANRYETTLWRSR